MAEYLGKECRDLNKVVSDNDGNKDDDDDDVEIVEMLKLLKSAQMKH